MKTYEELLAEIIALNAIIDNLRAKLANVGDALKFITDPVNIL